MPITALPTPPLSTDPANFAVRSDAFLGALPTFQSELNVLAADVASSAATASSEIEAATAVATVDAQAAAVSAAASALSASTYAATAVNTPWQPGTIQNVSGTSVTATAGNHYVLSNVAVTTVTLPASPAEWDVVWMTSANGLRTNVVARNGRTIMGLADDLIIDTTNKAFSLRYINATWRVLT